MASGIFALFDDIAVLMDDVSVMGKVAAKKTAGVLGDDLAVNAEKATGFHASRELPVLWAITKGSFLNKLIILPLAFILSSFAPWLIVPILLLGGAYLSFEGTEKILEWIKPPHKHPLPAQTTNDAQSIIDQEKEKITSAVRTDFILSIEIIVIALGTVMSETLLLQIIVVSFIAMLATVGVYGLVALLVRMDDAGFYLINQSKTMDPIRAALTQKSGEILVASLPKVIRVLGIVGTLAMLFVGGGMFVHHIEDIHHLLAFLPFELPSLIAGLIVGSVLVALVHLYHTFTKHSRTTKD